MRAGRRNEWLDLCRAFAISLVLLGHGRLFVRDALPWADYLRFGGFIGVELFFVLSGFLIGGILVRLAKQGGAHWLGGFYARRWFRTLPNYYLFLLVNLLLVWAGFYAGDLGEFWKYLIFVQNLASPVPRFFSESWSLAQEEVFYLLFPAAFLMVSRLFRWPHLRSIAVVALAVIVASLVARVLAAGAITDWDGGIRRVVLLRLDSLMFGVLLAWIAAQRPAWLRRRGVVAAALASFVACVLYAGFVKDMNHSFFAKTIYFDLTSIGCAGVLLAGIERAFPPWLVRPGAYLARISYSVYLAHIPVMFTLVHFFGCCSRAPGPALAMWAAFLVLTVLVAHVVHHVWETPFNRLRDRLFPAAVPAVAHEGNARHG
jgi:peptidoglycan/LPS O-acetylase OafA/YrhL